MADKRFTIKENRWRKALLEGMELTGNGGVRSVMQNADGEPAHFHTAILPMIDSGEVDSKWGRLHCDTRHDTNTAIMIYALAVDELETSVDGENVLLNVWLMDPEIPVERKFRHLKDLGTQRSANHEDVLLYQHTGRYLFLAVNIVGDDEAELSGMRVYAQGDNFEQTFPEIYHSRGGFFHRYLSIFSTIYNDFQNEIDDMPRILDVETCPSELLPVYASWLGIDLTGGFLPEDVCRALVREGYQLSKRKGTRWALTRIIEIVLGCEAEILEHNTMRGYLLSDGAEIPENLRSGGIYDVTILVHGKIKETLRHQLLFLLDQFKPVRTAIRLVQLSDTAVADGNAYLDMNATIPVAQSPTLDSDSAVGDVITLE